MAKGGIGACAAVLAVLLLAGCGDASPIVSAQASDATGTHDLSGTQLRSLNAWLDAHRGGWGLVLATPPAADLVLAVRRADGSSGSLSFYPQPGWAGAVTYFAADPKDSAQASFGAQEVRVLRNELAAPP